MNAGFCRSCLSITSVHSNESHARRLFHPQEFAAVRISPAPSYKEEKFMEQSRTLTLYKQLEQQWESLTIQNRYLFAKVMGDPDNCLHFLQLVLPDIHISSIESIRTEGTIEAGPDSKSVRLDILCSSENGNYYDIEMQAQDTGELPKRSRYYSSMMDEMQLQHSGMYKELADSYVIFLCSFDPFKRGKYCYVFRSTCVGCPDLELGDGQSRIFLNAAGRMNDVPPELRAFLDYVGGKPAGRSDDSYVQQIDRAVRRAKKNAVWRKQYMDWEMEKKEIEWTARKEGRAEGLAEGEAKGKAENLAENIKILAAYLKSLDDSLTMEQAMRRASEILQSKNV